MKLAARPIGQTVEISTKLGTTSIIDGDHQELTVVYADPAEALKDACRFVEVALAQVRASMQRESDRRGGS